MGHKDILNTNIIQQENVSLALLMAAQEESDGAFNSDVLQLVQVSFICPNIVAVSI